MLIRLVASVTHTHNPPSPPSDTHIAQYTSFEQIFFFRFYSLFGVHE